GARACWPDGWRLPCAGSRDGPLRRWDARSGEPLSGLGGYDQGVWSVAFSPDGQTLAAGTSGGNVLLWEADAEPDADPFDELPGHMDWVSSLAVSPDGAYPAAGSGATFALASGPATGAVVP